MNKEKDLTEKAVKKEMRGYYYAGVHQHEGECDEDKFVDIVCCDQYGVSYESCYDGWDYIIRKVPDYEDVCSMESQIKRLQEQIKYLKEQIKELEGYRRKTQQQLDDANKLLQYECSELMDVKFYLKKWGVK